jgi:hypothetical protein
MIRKVYDSIFILIYFLVEVTERKRQRQTVKMRVYSSTLILSTFEIMNIFTFLPFGNGAVILFIFAFLNALNAMIFTLNNRYLRLFDKSIDWRSYEFFISVFYILLSIVLFFYRPFTINF